MKRVLNNSRPVRVWYNTEFASPEKRDLSPDTAAGALMGTGLGMALQDDNIPTNIIGSATRLSPSAVLSLSSVIVVVDVGRVKGLGFGQVADYVGMIGLAEINLDADLGSMPTVLRLFRNTPDPPQGLSDWDQAFLSSLYSTNQASAAQEATMMRIMLSSLAPPVMCPANPEGLQLPKRCSRPCSRVIFRAPHGQRPHRLEAQDIALSRR